MGSADTEWKHRLDGPGPSRVPSRPEEQPWNTVGLPRGSNAVKKAIRDIENRLHYEKNKEQENASTQGFDFSEIARTRLLWQARERGHEENDQNNPTTQYRTDFYPDYEPHENVIILQVDEIPVPKKDVTVQTTNVETIETYKVQSYFDYEKSWNDFRSFVFSSKPRKISAVNSAKISSVDSQIPRITKNKICLKCPKLIEPFRLYCDVHDSAMNLKPKNIYIDPQRSRANFFGNSNSYALRCNLSALPPKNQICTNRRRFYMSPDPPISDNIDVKSGFQTFQAKKRMFYRQKLVRPPQGLGLNGMW